jgi:hypothetical protein
VLLVFCVCWLQDIVRSWITPWKKNSLNVYGPSSVFRGRSVWFISLHLRKLFAGVDLVRNLISLWRQSELGQVSFPCSLKWAHCICDMSDLYGKSSVIRWIRVLFGLIEMQEGAGCGEMTGRVEVCFLWVVHIYWL